MAEARGPTPGSTDGLPRILATDDRPEVLRLVDRALGGKYECEFASSVIEAREKLEGPPFQVALCDVQMPGESGLVLVEEIARNHPVTAIVLVTGVDDPEVADHAFRLGAHGYLVKPFWPGQLVITTANAVRQHQLELAEQTRHAALLGSAEEKAEALRHELIEAQRGAIEDLRASRQETVEKLALAIEMHDPETGRHIDRMAAIAASLGESLGLDPEQVHLLRAAAPMHDIGKIVTPGEILRKAGPLNSEERKLMEEHTIVGHQILADSESDLLKMAARIALSHHEWFDGSGYPHGVSNGDIPLEGRIVAVADAFDALLSNRPYRPAMSIDKAVEVIRDGKGSQFDPAIADTLLERLDELIELRAD